MNKDQQAPEPVHVTPELSSKDSENENRQVPDRAERKVIPFWWYATLVICLTILLIGILKIPELKAYTLGASTQLSAPHADMDALNVLESAAGFPIKTPKALPFKSTETSYKYLGTGMIQVVYQGSGQTACWRQSLGAENNSEESNDYSTETSLIISGQAVTLKGRENGYVLAFWTDGTYSYSLSFSEPLMAEKWYDILTSVS